MNLRGIHNFYIALDAVRANKMRTVLTALGIIFGVAAVIAMLAIGNGAKQEIMDQAKLIGLNNIVIAPLLEEKEDTRADNEKAEVKKKFSPGLSLADAENMAALPSVKLVSPEIIIEKQAIREGYSGKVKVIGVENSFFTLNNFTVETGSLFNRKNLESGDPVCVIGKGVETRFFRGEPALGEMIKCGDTWLRVEGVLSGKDISAEAMENLQIRDYNQEIYIPLKTALLRFRNRALITEGMIETQSMYMSGEVFVMGQNEEESKLKERRNYHQLDRLIVQVHETEQLRATEAVISRMLERRHNKVLDYTTFIPELLIKQQQRQKEIFNIVLGAIAGISLMVGGIGIMNIMLASVLERIREIGLRLSVGARKNDIVQQFLLEAIVISITGGLIGILTGATLAILIEVLFDITTIIRFSSVILAFVVSASVGLFFGWMPARRAAQQDPIKSLRYE